MHPQNVLDTDKERNQPAIPSRLVLRILDCDVHNYSYTARGTLRTLNTVLWIHPIVKQTAVRHTVRRRFINKHILCYFGYHLCSTSFSSVNVHFVLLEIM